MPLSTRTPGASGHRSASALPVVGHEAALGAFGIEPEFDGVARDAHVLLREAKLLARGDPHLLAHEIDAGDHLGHRVLDLQARVHFEEEELALGRR